MPRDDASVPPAIEGVVWKQDAPFWTSSRHGGLVWASSGVRLVRADGRTQSCGFLTVVYGESISGGLSGRYPLPLDLRGSSPHGEVAVVTELDGGLAIVVPPHGRLAVPPGSVAVPSASGWTVELEVGGVEALLITPALDPEEFPDASDQSSLRRQLTGGPRPVRVVQVAFLEPEVQVAMIAGSVITCVPDRGKPAR